MALLADFIGHAVQMRGVAIKTRGEIAMAGVAGRAIQGCVDGVVFLKLLQLAVVASGTGGGDGSGQFDF